MDKKQILATVLILFGTFCGYLVCYAIISDFGTPGVQPEYIPYAIMTAVGGGLVFVGIRLTVKGFGTVAMSLFFLIAMHLMINLKSVRHYATYEKHHLQEEVAALLSGPEFWTPVCAAILGACLMVIQKRSKKLKPVTAGPLKSGLKKSKVSKDMIDEPAEIPRKNINEPAEVPVKKIDKPTELTQMLKRADETLYQNNNPEYETNLAKRFMASPEDAIRIIKQRGWEKRGKAEETNRFLIRILSRILNEGDERIKAKALEALVNMFITPDDNTTGWVSMLEQSASVIAQSKMPGAKDKLESLRSKVSGKNLEAIDFALNLLKSS